MTAGNTFTPITSTTLSSDQPSFTFSSIPSTYTDLVIVTNNRLTSTGLGFLLNINGGSTSLSYQRGGSDGATTFTSNITDRIDITGVGSGAGAGLFATHILNVMSYANTNGYKTILFKSNNASNSSVPGFVIFGVGNWHSTAAINAITFIPAAGNIASGSIFTLYGIAAA